MGVFNSVYIPCPHCGEEQEEQYKPGYMQSWTLGRDLDIPLEYLEDFKDRSWHCDKCENSFYTDAVVEVVVKIRKDVE